MNARPGAVLPWLHVIELVSGIALTQGWEAPELAPMRRTVAQEETRGAAGEAGGKDQGEP